MKLKTGTRIEVRGWDLSFRETWEPARIGRWHPSYRDVPKPEGYHPITYASDGGKMLCHEENFRVVDNR